MSLSRKELEVSARPSRWRSLAAVGIVWLEHRGIGLTALGACREEQQRDRKLMVLFFSV